MAKEADLLPYFRVLDSEAGPVVEMEGRETIMLGSNNYLGLTGDPRVKQAARDALETYGTGLTGSRLLNGTTPLHLELERELAEWMQTEDVIVFTTGYQANVGCIGTVLALGDTVICDSADHASILDGCKLSGAVLRPFRHNQMPKLEKMLDGGRRRGRRDGGGRRGLLHGGRPAAAAGDRRALPLRRAADGRRGARVGASALGGAGATELFGLEDGSTCGWARSPRASPPAAASSPAPPTWSSTCGSRALLHLQRLGRPRGRRRGARGAAGDPLEGLELMAKLLDNAATCDRAFAISACGSSSRARCPTAARRHPGGPGDGRRGLAGGAALEGALRGGVYTNVAIHLAVPPGGALRAPRSWRAMSASTWIGPRRWSRRRSRTSPTCRGRAPGRRRGRPATVPPNGGLSRCPLLDKTGPRTKSMLLANADGARRTGPVDAGAPGSIGCGRRRTHPGAGSGRDGRE